MMDVYFYIIKVVSYWKMEYPDKHIGDSVLDIYDNKELKGLIKNCHYLNWPAPKCCSRINEMFFADSSLTIRE